MITTWPQKNEPKSGPAGSREDAEIGPAAAAAADGGSGTEGLGGRARGTDPSGWPKI